jgi:hypothetical protein
MSLKRFGGKHKLVSTRHMAVNHWLQKDTARKTNTCLPVTLRFRALLWRWSPKALRLHSALKLRNLPSHATYTFRPTCNTHPRSTILLEHGAACGSED